MKTAKLYLFVAWLLVGCFSRAEYQAGYATEWLRDETRDRPILIDWWYPTMSQTIEPVDYGLGRGSVAQTGTVATGRFPVVVLSHGALSAARDYSWIAERLARAGFLVAGVSHYEESYVYGTETVDSSAVLRAWQRPMDISAAISFIATKSQLADSANTNLIAFLGHSAGGATGMGLAGLRFDTTSMANYCRSDRSLQDRGCRYADGAAAPLDPELAEADYRDSRIKAFITLDPALAPAFQDFSTLSDATPFLLIGPVDNDFFPADEYVEHYAANLPNAEVHRLGDGEGHFIFLSQCEQDLKANGVPLCMDRPGVDRGKVHARLAPLILNFLKTTLSPLKHS
ncbi:MAG: hypothetical protein AAGI72_14860 [Pseudomonadota bacterium]